MLLLQLLAQGEEALLGAGGALAAVGVVHRLLDVAVQLLRQMSRHVAALVNLAALDQSAVSEDISDGGSQRLAAVDDEEA